MQYRRLDLRLVREASLVAPNDVSASTYLRASRGVGRWAVFDTPRRDRLREGSGDSDSSARVGRRVYWSGSVQQPRREGTVVAVYRELRDGSEVAVLVVDVRWDPPSPAERPRGPLSLGIPIARIGTSGWGWVDQLEVRNSPDVSPSAALGSDDQHERAMRRRFGIAVRQIRTSQGLSQERLAATCGLHRTFVGAIERGETNISLATLARLAKGLGVSVSHLAAEAESILQPQR